MAKVRDIMSSPVVTVAPDAPFDEVVERLLAEGVSGLPVVDEDGLLLGIVTEADLVSNQAYGYRRKRALALVFDHLRGRDPQWVRKSSGRRARDLMSGAVSVVAPDEEVAAAARRMLEDGHKRLPVVEEGRLVGIVSRMDLLRPYCRKDVEIAADVSLLLVDPLRTPEDHQVRAQVERGVVTLLGSVRVPSDSLLVEAMAARIPGVVAVDNLLEIREGAPDLATIPRPQ
jgi:CBS domain-containing protein